MQYRKFGKMDEKISALGFGTMRLPLLPGEKDDSKIDENAAIAMIRHAIDEGVNYLDTAFFYHNGASEKLVGKAIKDGYREKTYIATKMPVYAANKTEDFDEFLNTQLERLGVECIDFYLLHNLTKEYWQERVLPFKFLDKMLEAKKAGKIRHIGFSFHDDYESFCEIVDGFDWEFCQIQMNYLDVDQQATLKGLKYAADRGLGVVIMEPLLGGKLAQTPKPVREIFASSDPNKDPVEWGLDFLWDMPEVSFLLSGMSDMQQVKDNIEYAKRSGIKTLTEKEHATIAAVQEKFKSFDVIPCTACRYCLPCPQGVNIPRNFAAYNELHTYESKDIGKGSYERIVVFDGKEALSDNCIACQQCEALCPQHIKISEWMPKVTEAMK